MKVLRDYGQDETALPIRDIVRMVVNICQRVNLNYILKIDLVKGACYDFLPDLIHFFFSILYEQSSLEQSNSKV